MQRSKPRKEARDLMLVALFMLAAFGLIAFMMMSGRLEDIDARAAEWIGRLESDGMTAFMRTITDFGSTRVFAVVLVVTAGYFLWKRSFAEAMGLVFALLGAWGINTLLKNTFDRARPMLEHLVEAEGYSFPSGNAMIATAFYGLLAWLIMRKTSAVGAVVYSFIVFLILLIGISRVYLHVHFPSDIITGFLMGAAWMNFCAAGILILKARKLPR